MSAEVALLEVAGLSVRLPGPTGDVVAVDGVDVTMRRGQSLGVVGESGAGKSQLALAIPGLSPPQAVVSGRIRFDGADLLGATAAELRQVRGAAIGVVFQDPQAALAPHLSIGTQLVEVLAAHAAGPLDARRVRAEAIAILERVRVPDAGARLGQYPHELSGGLKQRVCLAMALIARPALLIADEPTTALDVTVEAGILDLLREVVEREGTSLLLVSHDLAVVEGLCDQIAVLYAGRIVESGPTASVLGAPSHPYTAALAASRLTLATPVEAPVAVIPGSPPRPGTRTAGCAFAPRCARARSRCLEADPALAATGPRRVACHWPLEAGARP